MPLATIGVSTGASVGIVSWLFTNVWTGFNSERFYGTQDAPSVVVDGQQPLPTTEEGPRRFLRDEDSEYSIGSEGLLNEAVAIGSAMGGAAVGQVVQYAQYAQHALGELPGMGRISRGSDLSTILATSVTDPDEDHRRYVQSHTDADPIDGCVWWHAGDVARNDVTCGQNALLRTSSSVLSAAMRRAKRCSSSGGSLTDCVLSHEIGLGVLGIYVHDESCAPGEMRAVLSPTVISSADVETTEQRRVRIRSRHTSKPSIVTRLYNASIDVQYLGGKDGEMHLTTARLRGVSAYCLQLLLESVDEQCAETVINA